MYEIVKSVIESGRYELSDMLKKIDTIWLQGDIAEDQRAELIDLSREKAVPENSYASLQSQIRVLFENYAELAAEIKALKEATEEDAEEAEEYPLYVQPTGVHDAYIAGDKVTYNDKHYICIAPEGVPVVWSPDVYPAYWQLVEEEEMEAE